MKTLENPITNKEEAEAFFAALKENDKLFHLDDDPFDLLHHPTQERTFTDEQAHLVELRVNELHNVLDDPFEMLMAVVESEQ